MEKKKSLVGKTITALIVLLIAVAGESAGVHLIKRVSLHWGYYEGYSAYPPGTKPIFDPQTALLIKSNNDVNNLVRKYGKEFNQLKDSAISAGDLVIVFYPCVTRNRPKPHEITGTLSTWDPIEERGSVPMITDDGSNETGWDDPLPRNIEADFLLQLHEGAQPINEDDDMSGYREEGIFAELVVIDGKPTGIEAGLLTRRIIIVKDVAPKWNQIGLASHDHLLEIHWKK